MRSRITDLTIGLDGKQRLTLELDGDFRADFDKLHDKPVSVTVKQYREKRSLDANAYAWVLIDKIAEKMRITKAEVYKQAIREIGGVSETVCAQTAAVEKITDIWTKNGVGWQVEKMNSKIPGCTVLILYYGSSTYDTKQMSALIDLLVQEAKSLGIETRPEEEIRSLLEEYNA